MCEYVCAQGRPVGTHTDAQGCINDRLGPRTSVGVSRSSLPLSSFPVLSTRFPLPACYSLQVRSLWRHMERGKLTTRRKSPQQQEASIPSLTLWLSALPLLQTKFKDVEREREKEGGDKINGVQHFNTTPAAIFAQNEKKKREREISSYSSVILWYYKSDPGLSILRPCFINVH